MKLRVGDKLKFRWDKNAPSSRIAEKELFAGKKVKQSLEKYFDFLNEFRPSKREILEVKIFNNLFSL